MSEFEILLHWVYVLVMFGSALLFAAWSRNPKQIPMHKYLLHIMIVVWSGLVYSAMAMDQGYLHLHGEKVVYARYIDWVVSTPLLVIALSYTSMLLIDKVYWLKGALIFFQVVMILTGLVAELSPEGQQWYWYAMGCIALFIQLYLFWGPLKRLAAKQGDELQEVYKKSATYLTVQWLLYPTVWLIGSMGLGLLDPVVTTVLYIILPIVSKAGFGMYNLHLLRNMKHKEELKHQPV
jgi:bacteriorhodopsin